MTYWSKLQVRANSNVPFSAFGEAHFRKSVSCKQDITWAYFYSVLTMGTLYAVLAAIIMISSSF